MHGFHTTLLSIGVLSLIACNQTQDVDSVGKMVELCFSANVMDIEAEIMPSDATRSSHTTQQDAAFETGATFSIIAFDYSDSPVSGVVEQEAAHYVMHNDGVIRPAVGSLGVCSHDWKRLRIFAVSPDLMQFTRQNYASSDVYVQEDQTTTLGERLSDWIVGTDDNNGLPFQPEDGKPTTLKCHHLFSKILLTVSLPADEMLVGKTVTPVISNVVQRAHVNPSTVMSQLHYHNQSLTDYYFQYMFEHTTGVHIISNGIRMANYEITQEMVEEAQAAHMPITFQCSCIVLPDVGTTGFHHRPNFHIELTTQNNGSTLAISTDTISAGSNDYKHYRSSKRYRYSVSVSRESLGLTTEAPILAAPIKGANIEIKTLD